MDISNSTLDFRRILDMCEEFETFSKLILVKYILCNIILIPRLNVMFYILIARIIYFSAILTLNDAVLSVEIVKFCENLQILTFCKQKNYS